MAQYETKIKDPDDELDYIFDFAAETNGTEGADGDWLATGETIASYTVTVETGLTKDSDSNTDDTVTVWLSGGTAGTTYSVTCQITTSASRKKTYTGKIYVREA
jgi:hypothetical protein